MHEFAITENIVKIVSDEAIKAGATKVTHINITMGELSTVVDESVQMYFDIISENTIAHGAILNFKKIPAKLKCQECEHVFEKVGSDLLCPLCENVANFTEVGREFFIENIEVE